MELETKTMLNWNSEMLKPFMDVYWSTRGGRKSIQSLHETPELLHKKISTISSTPKLKKKMSVSAIDLKVPMKAAPDIVRIETTFTKESRLSK